MAFNTWSIFIFFFISVLCGVFYRQRKENAQWRLCGKIGREGEFNESATYKINALKAKYPSGIPESYSQKC